MMAEADPNRARRNLVLVRAGARSLHEGWVSGPGRSFDLAISRYAEAATAPTLVPDLEHAHRGGKWDGIAAFLDANPQVLETYDFIWLPDDDIQADEATIERMFDLARQWSLDICQPALSCDSYFSYVETIGVDGFLLRYSTLVEIMVPCLSTAFLREIRPLFAGTMSGFGIDMIWARLHPPAAMRSAILDVCRVRHTRPVGAVLRGSIVRAGGDQWQERDAMLARFGAREIRPTIHAARDTGGRLVHGRLRLALAMAAAYRRQAHHFVQPLRRKHIRRLVANHLLPSPFAGRPIWKSQAAGLAPLHLA